MAESGGEPPVETSASADEAAGHEPAGHEPAEHRNPAGGKTSAGPSAA